MGDRAMAAKPASLAAGSPSNWSSPECCGGAPAPAWAWPMQGLGFSSTLRAAVSQTYLVSRYLSGVLGLFLRFAPHGLELKSS